MPKRKPTAKKAAAPAAKSAPKSGAPAASNFDLAHIREIVGLMADNDLSYFHFEQKESKLEIRRGSDFAAAGDLLKHLPVPPAAAPVAVAAPAPVAARWQHLRLSCCSRYSSLSCRPHDQFPMVGTFYRSAAPGEKSFANVGDQVDENTTVCIIEAMKVMNEIKAEARGTIARILAEDGKPVQYGQPLFELKA
jgi:acetyl-CoA carboxylase biotin carboxyl carrier protein